MSAKKILLLTVTIIVALICLGFLGVRTFVQQVADNRDCEWANVDHIEMRAVVNIPPVKNFDCDYQPDLNRKTTVFELDLSKFDVSDYVSKFGYRNVVSVPENFSEFDSNGVEKADVSSLFYREGTTETNSYKILLDAKSGKLWVDLQYFHD